MAVTTNTVAVGTGDNWTNTQLLDAMEAAFQACGLHGGTARYGVPTMCLAPVSYTNLTLPTTPYV